MDIEDAAVGPIQPQVTVDKLRNPRGLGGGNQHKHQRFLRFDLHVENLRGLGRTRAVRVDDGSTARPRFLGGLQHIFFYVLVHNGDDQFPPWRIRNRTVLAPGPRRTGIRTRHPGQTHRKGDTFVGLVKAELLRQTVQDSPDRRHIPRHQDDFFAGIHDTQSVEQTGTHRAATAHHRGATDAHLFAGLNHPRAELGIHHHV